MNPYNPSDVLMRQGIEEDTVKLMKMREFDRGFQAGKKAKEANEWALDQERKKVIDRLSKLDTNDYSLVFNDKVFSRLFDNPPEVLMNADILDRLIYLLGGNCE